MEGFVVQFPALVIWLMGLGGVGFAGMVAMISRQVLKRMDDQDAAIEKIPGAVSAEIKILRELVQTEIKELREGQHRLANRVVSIEAFNKAKFAFEHPSALNAIPTHERP
jgi:hypothetical protein